MQSKIKEEKYISKNENKFTHIKKCPNGLEYSSVVEYFSVLNEALKYIFITGMKRKNDNENIY